MSVISPIVSQGFHFIIEGDYSPGFSQEASLLDSWQCPANFKTPREWCNVMKSYKEKSTGGRSNYYRCENLTTNYLTPLLSVVQCNAYDRIFISYQSYTCLFVCSAAKANGGCPIGTFFILTCPGFILSYAPRLVLMRRTTRSEVVFLDRSFLLPESPCLITDSCLLLRKLISVL